MNWPVVGWRALEAALVAGAAWVTTYQATDDLSAANSAALAALAAKVMPMQVLGSARGRAIK